MKRIGIVSPNVDTTVELLSKSIRRKGHTSVYINPLEFSAHIGREKKSSPTYPIDMAIIRDVGGVELGTEGVSFRFERLKEMSSDIPVINPLDSILVCANKYLTTSLLLSHGVPVPETLLTQDTNEAIEFIEECGDAVVKPIYGYKGKGILRFRPPVDRNLLESILKQRGVLYLQKFVGSGKGDVRVFVVGKEVLGAVRRIPSNNWISNLSQGASPHPFGVDDELVDISLKAREAVGIEFGGIDIIYDSEGIYVLEVNATPSVRGLYSVGIDPSDKILNLLLDRG
jgi:tetrahydromethanopterin:alpha-L-glutamate ligase